MALNSTSLKKKHKIITADLFLQTIPLPFTLVGVYDVSMLVIISSLTEPGISADETMSASGLVPGSLT